MWIESVLVVSDQIVDAAEPDGWRLSVGAGDETRSRILLVHLTRTEDHASCAAYSALTLQSVQGDATQRRVWGRSIWPGRYWSRSPLNSASCGSG